MPVKEGLALPGKVRKVFLEEGQFELSFRRRIRISQEKKEANIILDKRNSMYGSLRCNHGLVTEYRLFRRAGIKK